MDTDMLHQTIYWAWESMRGELREQDTESALCDYLAEWFRAGFIPKTTKEMGIGLDQAYNRHFDPYQYDAMIHRHRKRVESRNGH